MKIRPLTILTVVALVGAGAVYLSDKVTSSKQATVTVSSPTSIPTSPATPNRELKPNERFIGPAGLYVIVPEDMNFREEKAVDDPGMPRTASFYIEKMDSNELSYQLYGLYNVSNSAAENSLEKSKKEMDPSTIKDVSVGGYKGIEGTVLGPKGRYMIVIVKDGKLHSFSTYPPTPENKEITDQILSTVNFQ